MRTHEGQGEVTDREREERSERRGRGARRTTLLDIVIGGCIITWSVLTALDINDDGRLAPPAPERDFVLALTAIFLGAIAVRCTYAVLDSNERLRAEIILNRDTAVSVGRHLANAETRLGARIAELAEMGANAEAEASSYVEAAVSRLDGRRPRPLTPHR